MKCDACGTTAQPASTNRAFRCLNCGTLMNVTAATAPPPVVVSASNHSYSTPHGKLSAQVQRNGSWRVAVSLTPAAGKSDAAAILVKNLLSSWATLNDAALPTLHSFAAKELRCIWALPGSAGFVPLAARRPPLESCRSQKLVIALAEPLGRLHRLGLAAYDLSPSLIFETPGTGRAVLIPTPWLASLAQWAPAKVGELPFVAPELSLVQQASPDPSRPTSSPWARSPGSCSRADYAPVRRPSSRSKSPPPWPRGTRLSTGAAERTRPGGSLRSIWPSSHCPANLRPLGSRPARRGSSQGRRRVRWCLPWCRRQRCRYRRAASIGSVRGGLC